MFSIAAIIGILSLGLVFASAFFLLRRLGAAELAVAVLAIAAFGVAAALVGALVQ